MPCLVHDTQYRYLFNAVVNELRKQNRIPALKLRSMPRQCCTCNDVDNQTLTTVVIDDKHKLINLKKLIDRLNRDKINDPKIDLSLNRLENFIHENQILDTNILSTSAVDNEDIHDSKMDVQCSKHKDKTQNAKALKTGTFVYLPYKSKKESDSDVLVNIAKQRQRGRFIGRNGYIPSLQKEHNVHINMITPKTTVQIKKTLANAKSGAGKVTIYNRKDLPVADENGEWIFVRPKDDGKDASSALDVELLMNDLVDRWSSFLTIEKRKSADDSDEEDECQRKKR